MARSGDDGGARIMVVEDDPHLAVLIETCLVDQAGWLEVAPDGLAALDLAARAEPELVVLDIELPGLDGIEVCRRLKAHEEPPAILMLSARAGKPARLAAYEAGADDFLAKPFEPEELQAKVRAIVRVRRAERAARRQARRFEALAAMGRAVGATLDVASVLERGATAARELLDAAEVHFWRLEPASRELQLAATAAAPSPGRPPPLANRRLPLDDSAIGRVLLDGRSVASSIDRLPIRHGKAYVRERNFRGALIVPLERGDRKLGVMTALYEDEAAVADEDVRLAEAFADQAALLLDHAELYQEARAEAEVSTALLRVTRETATETSEGGLVRRAAELTLGLFGADACIPLAYDDAIAGYRALWRIGDLTDDDWTVLHDAVFASDSPALADLARSPRVVTHDDPAGPDGLYPPGVAQALRQRATLAIPLVAGERLLGLLAVTWSRRQRHFVDRDRRLAEGLAGLLALGLERVRLFRALARSETHYRLVTEHASDAVLLLMPDGKIVFANPAAERMIGTEPGGLNGRLAGDFVSTEADRVENRFGEILRGGRWFGELLGRRMDGAPFPLLVSLSAVPDESGQATAIVVIGRDVGERKAFEQRLAEVDKLRAIGTMASGIAHDFNNLLGMILARAELARVALERGETRPGEMAEVLRGIEVAAEDGAQAVRRMQRFAQIDQGTERTVLNVAETIRGAVDLTRPRWRDEALAAGRVISLRVHLGDDLCVEGSAPELRAVLVNLIFNGVDASPKGGVIQIDATREGDRVRIRVCDSGKGMPEEVRRRCFEPFFTTKGVEGNGLGLAEAWGIIRRHGGEISVESEPGAGTTFLIDLPAARPRQEAPAAGSRPAPVGTLRVLVADDEPALANILGETLRALGHEPTVCTGGEEAAARFDPALHDVVMTDQGMPGLTGTGLARIVKERAPDTPVFLITGWGGQMEEIPADVDAIIPKPYRMAAIRDALAQAEAARASAVGS